MRCPSSPGQGGESRPASSFWNFTHMTLRPLLLVAGAAAAWECPQESAMLLIVVDLRGREHRQLGVDRKPQMRVRGAQRALDAGRRGGAGEDEPEVAGAFRQRQQQLIRLRRNAHVVDVW